MRNTNALWIVVFAVVCFGAGLLLGSRINDHWKVVEHDTCMGTIQIVVPVGAYEDRRQALSGAFQQLQRCDQLADLATLDNLTAGRLDELIMSR